MLPPPKPPRGPRERDAGERVRSLFREWDDDSAGAAPQGVGHGAELIERVPMAFRGCRHSSFKPVNTNGPYGKSIFRHPNSIGVFAAPPRKSIESGIRLSSQAAR